MVFQAYTCLQNQTVERDGYQIRPIQFDDRMMIMKWRNEQIYHLRQNKPLTEQDQDAYFKNSVSQLFSQETPSQLLFSYTNNGMLLGYGGLVHMNWIDKYAEISFLMNTELEKEEFEMHWKNFLKMIEHIAFNEIQFHKIFTYAFDLRPRLYSALEDSGFMREAVLKEHCLFNGQFIDVIIHSKINK